MIAEETCQIHMTVQLLRVAERQCMVTFERNKGDMLEYLDLYNKFMTGIGEYNNVAE